MELRERSVTVDVPRNTGVEGFIVTIRELLRKPRIQEIVINAQGKVTYKRMVHDNEEEPINIDLETVTPAGVMSRAQVEEMVLPPHLPAAISIGKMMDRFAIDQVTPIAFVSGAATVFWEWYKATTRSALHARNHIFGLPLLADRRTPDTALLLFGTATSSSSLIDTTHVLKLEMETGILKPPDTTVSIL